MTMAEMRIYFEKAVDDGRRRRRRTSRQVAWPPTSTRASRKSKRKQSLFLLAPTLTHRLVQLSSSAHPNQHPEGTKQLPMWQKPLQGLLTWFSQFQDEIDTKLKFMVIWIRRGLFEGDLYTFSKFDCVSSVFHYSDTILSFWNITLH